MTDQHRSICLHCDEPVGPDGQEVWPGQWWCTDGARIEVERLTASCRKCGGHVGPDGVRDNDEVQWLCRDRVAWIGMLEYRPNVITGGDTQ
ncbi:hypothetical protein ABIB25_000988 [Nakamurella sp. UYEF19]